MKPHERQPQIEAIIRREGEVSVETLAARFDVSFETIRRDLGILAEHGRIQKVHGGARRPQLIREPSHDERATTAAGAKSAIGRRLADAIVPGETLFIDTGSTTLAAAEALAVIPNLTVITNSCRLAERIARARMEHEHLMVERQASCRGHVRQRHRDCGRAGVEAARHVIQTDQCGTAGKAQSG